MSWNPFKKAFSSRKSRQDDQDFDHQVQRLHFMQTVSKRLYKEMSKCSDAESAQSKANGKLIFDLCANSSSKVEPLKSTVDEVSVCMDELQAHCKDHCSRQDITFNDPMKRFYSVYKHLEFHIKQRDARLQELERQQIKLDKRQASTSVSATKMELTQRKLASKKSEYERINERLMTEMPQLYDGRIDFFEPCVTAVIQSQLLYHQQSAATLQETLSQIESDQEPQKPITEYFNDIRSLSIIGNPT